MNEIINLNDINALTSLNIIEFKLLNQLIDFNVLLIK